MKYYYRDWQKRIIFADACYFVTCKTEGNIPFFRERIFCDLFVKNLRLCKQMKGFLLFGWVLAYDHFHLLVQPDDGFNISEVMHCLKRNVSRNINFLIGQNEHDEPPEGRDDHPDLRNLDSDIFFHIKRFIVKKWILKFRFQIKYLNQNPYPKFKWQDRFYDHYIRNDRDFNHHMDYIAYNPVKHDLPDDWSYVFTNPRYEDLIDDCV